MAIFVNSMEDMGWDLNTDFQASLKIILNDYKFYKVKPGEEPIKRLVVFSDMQFDEASGGDNTETVHQTCKRMYEEEGYVMPNIIYWNLRATNNVPVRVDETGTVLASGFNAQLLKAFMNPECEFNTLSIMKTILSKYIPDFIEDSDSDETSDIT